MKQYYISSNKCSIQERQTKKHGKVYDVVFRVVTLDGVEKQKKLSGYSSKALAKQGYLEFITENCELVKNNPIKKKLNGKQHPTIHELYATYISTLPNQNKESVIYDKRNTFELYILPKFKNLTIDKLTKEELYRWQDDLWSTKNPRNNEYYSYQYLSKTRTYFNSFLSWVENRYNYPNHFKTIPIPKNRTSKTEMQIWTKEEFEQFIAVVDNPMYKTLFIMLFYTGRRKGEVLALTTEDIKSDRISFNKTVTRKTLDDSPYKITSTKNEKKQSTLICKPLKKALQEYEGGYPFYFGGDRPLPDNSVTRVFQDYVEKAKVKRIRMHDLRHSFVSRCISLGAPLTVVAELIGDTLEQVYRTYAHLVENDLKTIINKL